MARRRLCASKRRMLSTSLGPWASNASERNAACAEYDLYEGLNPLFCVALIEFDPSGRCDRARGSKAWPKRAEKIRVAGLLGRVRIRPLGLARIVRSGGPARPPRALETSRSERVEILLRAFVTWVSRPAIDSRRLSRGR